MISLSHITNTMIADDLVKQGARSSAVMVLAKFSSNNIFQQQKGKHIKGLEIKRDLVGHLKRYHMLHDDVIEWKSFPCYCPFVRGIHRSPVSSHAQRPVTRSFDVFFDRRLNKRLSKQSRCRWFETPSHSLCRHCDATKSSWNHQCLKHIFKSHKRGE